MIKVEFPFNTDIPVPSATDSLYFDSGLFLVPAKVGFIFLGDFKNVIPDMLKQATLGPFR